MNDKASAAALAVKASNVIGVMAEVSTDGTYHRAQNFTVHIPTARTERNAHIYEEAGRMPQHERVVNLKQSKNVAPPGRALKLGRNTLCPCGSGSVWQIVETRLIAFIIRRTSNQSSGKRGLVLSRFC